MRFGGSSTQQAHRSAGTLLHIGSPVEAFADLGNEIEARFAREFYADWLKLHTWALLDPLDQQLQQEEEQQQPEKEQNQQQPNQQEHEERRASPLGAVPPLKLDSPSSRESDSCCASATGTAYRGATTPVGLASSAGTTERSLDGPQLPQREDTHDSNDE